VLITLFPEANRMPRLRVVDSEVDVAVPPNETLLTGLRRAGYAANIGCLRGGCGICRIRVIEGAISYRETVAETVLPPEERADGVCLLCRAVPETDTVIEVKPEFGLRLVSPLLAEPARR
jgi:CDP-4-dehydro-6-deoxyglucose reductase